MSLVYVSDTNIWIDLRNGGLLEEVFQLPLTFCSTDFVVAELEDIEHSMLQGLGLLIERLGDDATPTLASLMALHNNSSLADVSCYLLAKTTGFPLLTGDGRLRKQAKQDGIAVYGVLWLLDQLVANHVVSPVQASKALQLMLSKGARLPHEDCHSRFNRWRS